MIKKYSKFILENRMTVAVVAGTYKPTNLIQEVCVAMLLINNSFLDNILDKGIKSRYSENSQVFLTDLKNLLLAKNRLKLGKFISNQCIEDDETSKINGIFESVTFDIEKDWNKLIGARTTARNIIDKLIPNEKVTEDMVVSVFWLGPNKTSDNKEDLILELSDGRQYSFYVNRNISSSKTSSFITFGEDLIGNEIEKLHSDEYIHKWNKLVQTWVRTIYDNVNKNFQVHIEKFIEESRIDSLEYFNYFKIKHRDPRYKLLGEHIKEFDKNILNFSDLMSEIWKHRDVCFHDVEKVYNEWMESKIFILNSKILEHLLTESLTKNNIQEIKKLDDGFKLADGKVKMKFVKTIVDKLGCSERTTYYLGNNGNVFNQIPSRDFFRKAYNDLTVKFDYHVKMVVEDEEENNDFNIRIKLDMDDNQLVDFNIGVSFTGAEMSSKLSAKHKFELSDDFNFRVSEKMTKFLTDETKEV
jgi:hypothetical protein